MKDLGIIFCGKCNSTMVDSGFNDTPSNLRCCECNNVDVFNVGKVSLEENIYEDLLMKARKDANIRD